MISNQKRPLSETKPALIYGVVTFFFVFVIAAAGLYALAPLVDSDDVVAEEVADGGPTTPGGPVSVTLVARNLAFDKRTISASPGVDVTVTLDNQDAGVLHNVSFYTNRSAGTKIFVGELKAGVTQSVEKFKSPSGAGNYFFRCDAHPDQMTGTFVVK